MDLGQEWEQFKRDSGVTLPAYKHYTKVLTILQIRLSNAQISLKFYSLIENSKEKF